MLKKMQDSRKGISPILATLLLIVIAVAAVIVTYAWVMTFTASQTQQAGVVITRENVRYYGSPTSAAKNLTDIVIRNTGTADAKVVAVYWSSSGYSTLAKLTSGTDYDVTPSTGIIAAGSSITITIKWGPSPRVTGSAWSSGTTYYYKVVTEAGQYLELPEKAP
ncbi:MAG: hypothetical protein OEY30_03590 [Candidatus Bathyarchaeota archaeon]|nr:hypothetical protein [Candidatus Bathyarchaeota archaeon]